MLSRIPKDKLIIGIKQTKKVIANGVVKELYVAEDCDPMISDSLIEAANKSGIKVLYIPTMRALGSMCSISVGASCAAILK